MKLRSALDPEVLHSSVCRILHTLDNFAGKSAFGRRGFALIIASLFLFTLLPDISSPQPSISRSMGEFPHGDLLEVHEVERQYLDDKSVLSDVEPFLDDWIASGTNIPNPYAGISLSEVERQYPEYPHILEAAEAFQPEDEFSSVIDLLRNRILSYYVYVPYQGNDNDWREGNLRPGIGSGQLLGIVTGTGDGDFGTDWIPIDIDNADGDDNDATGTDIMVRMNPNLKRIGGFLSQSASGGINLEVINLGWNRSVDIYFLKAMEYSTDSSIIPGERAMKHALISAKLSFEVVPANARVSIQASELQFDADITTVITRQTGEMVDITGPVHVTWDFAEPIPSFNGGFVFFSEDESDGSTIRTWFDVSVTPGTGSSHIPESVELIASTSNPKKGFDNIHWMSPEKCNVGIIFAEERDNLTYAIIDIIDLAEEMLIDIREEVVEDGNITVMDFSASSRIPYLSYKSYQYLGSKFVDLTPETPMRFTMSEMRDMPLAIHVRGTFEFGEEVESPAVSTGQNIVGSLVDNLMLRVLSRFTRVSRTISSVPDKIMEAAGTGGYFVLDSSEELDITFLLTDGTEPSISDPETNYFVFMNSTQSESQLEIVVGGRLKGLKTMSGTIGNETDAQLSIMGRRNLFGYYIDPTRNFIARVELETIPENITMSMTESGVIYKASGGNNSFSYSSRMDDISMFVRAVNIPPEFYMDRGEEYVSLKTVGGSIGTISAILTNRTPESLIGNHIYVDRTVESLSLSLSLSNVNGLSYNRGTGEFVLETEEPAPIRILMSSTVEKNTFMKMLVDPLPTVFKANIPQTLSTRDIDIPDLSVTGGIMSIPNLLFSLSDMGHTIVNTLDSALVDTVTGLGELGTAVSFSYESTETTDITALMVYGGASESDIVWTHGITAKQTQNENDPEDISFVAKMYLPGLPKSANLTVDTRPPNAFFELILKEYNPKYPWIMMDVVGIQGRDIRLSLSDIPSPIDISLTVDMELEMYRGGGRISGSVSASVMQSLAPAKLGSLHIFASQDLPVKTRIEVLIPEVPSQLDMEIEMEERVYVDYLASRQLKYVLVSASRPMGDKVAGLSLLMRDVPSRVVLSVVPQTDLNIDGSMMQTLPELTFTASSPTLDLFVSADGDFMGQRGRYQVSVINMANYLSTSHVGQKYVIQGGGTEFLEVTAGGIPYSQQVHIHEVVIRAENLGEISIQVEPLFGFFPLIELTSSGTGGVEFLVRIRVLDSWEANAAFVLLTFREGELGSVPSHPLFMINGGALRLYESPRSIILADPGLTLILTAFSGGWL